MPGKILIRKGYILVYKPSHPYSSKWGYISQARYVLEDYTKLLLPREATFHHINGEKNDNRVDNLLWFLTSKEHTKYHRNLRAIEACGHPSWRRCTYCGEYGDPKDTEWRQFTDGNSCHKKCKSSYDRGRYERSGRCKHRTI